MFAWRSIAVFFSATGRVANDFKIIHRVAVGFALFLIASLRGAVKMNRRDMKAALWIVPYITGLIAISYLGSLAE